MSIGRRQYPFDLIEPKWQAAWDSQQAFRAWNPGETLPANHPFAARHKISGKTSAADLPPKYYVLDMFPYPSGAGLHVGHPEGYTATDILSRYRRATGFNVLHPMGWDAFGLPAEQYAIKTGQHPRATTEANVANFKRQIKSLGFSYDWSREVDTTDPNYFKWTQWIFLKLYNSYFDPSLNKAMPIDLLDDALSKNPKNQDAWKANHYLTTLRDAIMLGTKEDFKSKRELIDSKRLAFVSEAPVNWCPELGTVLANEEVVDGKSEVGGFPVVRRPMRQWMLRITAYAERLLNDLEGIDWSHSLKEMQRNWIGRSEGAEVDFQIEGSQEKIRVFTTRPDTLFGATYMVLAPENKIVDSIAPPAWPNNTPISWRGADLYAGGCSRPIDAISLYRVKTSAKSDLERTLNENGKEKTGVFTGAYAINPVNGEKIPIWIADYVLASYGTGAIMAVPAHDERDFEFAKKFSLAIKPVVGVRIPKVFDATEGFTSYGVEQQVRGVSGQKTVIYTYRNFCIAEEGVSQNSSNSGISLDDLPTPEAKKKIAAWLEEKGLGKKTINYKLRDWLFSRQRYWGEPFPIVWKRDAAGNLFHEALPESALPLLPPALTDFKPTTTGEPPLARAKDWVNLPDGSIRETNTMPQWAGSCWYYLRFLDARRSESFCGTLAEHYWMGSPTGGLLLTDSQWRSRLSELHSLALNNLDQPKCYVTYATIEAEEAHRLQAATGLDVEGYRRFIDNQAIKHILNEHGDPAVEESRGQLVVTISDIALIPLVVTQPDKVSHAGKTRRHLDGILYEKQINGFLCCVEELREGAALLAVKTFYKRKTTGARAVSSLDQTSETFRRSNKTIASNPAVVKPTPGVDLYVGGTEHAVLHLLYARFWHKVLFDLGYVSTPEPFFKLVNQGLILGEDGQKMSKSRGNVVNPDDILKEYGADAFRLYEMFMGPLEMVKPWNTKGVEGVYRFLGRVWRLFVDEQSETAFEQADTTTAPEKRADLLHLIKLNSAIQDVAPNPAQLKTLHACIKKVTEDLDALRFNTAISALMVFINEAMTWPVKPRTVLRDFLILLQPFSPHLAEELYSRLREASPTLAYVPWPKFDPALLVESTIEIPVQVNGKLRDVIVVAADAAQAQIEAAALASEKVKPFIEGKTIKKIIIVPKRLVNIAVG